MALFPAGEEAGECLMRLGDASGPQAARARPGFTASIYSFEVLLDI